tara:strand:- start:137 stop:367 length:231 start_codon:yes stop_codon:yes gene_type:complete
MPQIGWFEILIIAVVAILIIGPKDFPVVLKKIGSWVGSVKRYFSDLQREVDSFKNEGENLVNLDNKKNLEEKNEER